MFHRLIKFPPILLGFNLATVLPKRSIYTLTYIINTHILLCRLLGCQILIVTYTFVLQYHFTYISYLQIGCTSKL